jgi:hypothetical protein
MTSRNRVFLAAVLAATLFAAATARAEMTFPVNDNTIPGVFDQPSVAMNGQVAHVAFIGAASAAGPFKVHYAAVNGGADFTNLTLARSAILVTSPTIVDNTDLGGNDSYYDARHPAIAMRSATEAVIFFQAKQTSLDTVYSLYRARVRIDNNAVVEQRVNLVSNIQPGDDIQDVSFAIVAADNTARVAYATRDTSAGLFDLSFARVGLDNAEASAPVAINSAYSSSRGFRPVPSLKLDDQNRAHIAWAATDDSGTNPGPVYYAMIKETNGVDNMVIAPTPIMTREAMRYSFPSVLVFGRSLITVLAGDEVDGNLAYVQINPDAARQNGLPAWDNLSSNNSFLPVPPGEAILPDEFSLFRPEAFYESASGRIFLTGYGASGCTFFAVKIAAAAASVERVTDPGQFAVMQPPSSLPGDYTKAAFGFPGGKILAFWSGIPAPGSADRNLDVTTVPTAAAWITSNESGCAMVADPASGAAGRIPGALLLFLPAAVLAARRIAVNRRRLAARRPRHGARRPHGRTVGR